MVKFLASIIFSLSLSLCTSGQDIKETTTYHELIKTVLLTEKLADNLVYRLDTLQSKFIPSRSHLRDYFNRNIDFGFKHRRIIISLNFANYQLDLLCKNDTIFLSSIKSADYKSLNYDTCNKEVLQQFLHQRNKFYKSTKSPKQLVKEISLPEEYAFYCGYGLPQTYNGKYIEQLVDDGNISTLSEMLKSFNCETQAYGVAGLEMLQKHDFEISSVNEKLIKHIKTRNTELVVCSGCFSGIIEKIYSK